MDKTYAVLQRLLQLVPDACSAGGGSNYAATCPCNLDNNPCAVLTLNGVCDAGRECPVISDCFDGDPLHRFRDLGCEGCTANGGVYCETGNGLPLCSAPEIAEFYPTACSEDGGTEYYMSACQYSCNLDTDTCEYGFDFELSRDQRLL